MNIIGLTGKAGAGKDAVADVLVKNHGFVRVALADVMKRAAKEFFGFTDEQLWGPSEKRNAPDERFPRAHTYVGEVKGKTPCSCCGRHAAAILPVDEGCFLTPRFALQQLGTEYGRAMFEDVWINKALETARVLLARPMFEREGPGRAWRVQTYESHVGLRYYPSHDPERGRAKGIVFPDIRYPNELNAVRAEGGRIWHKEGSGSLGDTAAASHSSETSLRQDLAFRTVDEEIPWLDDVAQLPDIVKRLLETK